MPTIHCGRARGVTVIRTCPVMSGTGSEWQVEKKVRI